MKKRLIPILVAVAVLAVAGILWSKRNGRDDAHIRLSYACSMEHIEQGMDRMAAAVATLQ